MALDSLRRRHTGHVSPEKPKLPMSAAPKVHARDVASNHEHVGRISAPTTIFLLIIVVLVLYQIQWVLAPFVIAGLLAYICTPIVEWLASRTGAPRLLYASLVFLALIGIGTGIGVLVGHHLIGEMASVVSDLEGIIERITHAAAGDRTVLLFGEPLNAAQIAQAATGAVREWLGQPGRAATLAGLAFASMFGMILTLVLLFYFLVSGPAIMLGILQLAPPDQRPLLRHISSSVDPVLRRYFVGVFCVVAYATVAAYIGLGLFLGFPGPFSWHC